ncbi:MAG: DUF424 family protein [Candidatus Pacearchaeota archaeon]
MIVNIIKSYREIVAVCDNELLGKKFEEGKFQLDVKESFYKGNETSREETLKIMKTMAKEDATFNIVGDESVNTALEAGIIDKESIGEIKGVQFALVLI